MASPRGPIRCHTIASWRMLTATQVLATGMRPPKASSTDRCPYLLTYLKSYNHEHRTLEASRLADHRPKRRGVAATPNQRGLRRSRLVHHPRQALPAPHRCSCALRHVHRMAGIRKGVQQQGHGRDH